MAPLSRMLQTCYTGGTGRYTKRGDTMTGHALPRIYTAPKQQPADTPHRPSISIHVRSIGTRPPPAPPWPLRPAERWGPCDHGPTAGREKRPARTRRLAGPGRASSHSLSRTARQPWQPWPSCQWTPPAQPWPWPRLRRPRPWSAPPWSRMTGLQAGPPESMPVRRPWLGSG